MKPKILIVTTASVSLYMLHRGFYTYFQKFYDIHSLTGDSKFTKKVEEQGVPVKVIKMHREVSVLNDVFSFIKIFNHLLFNRYDIIHYSTFKASLIVSIVARLTFQKKTLYTVRGRAYENFKGIKLSVFMLIEKIICSFSDLVIPISMGLRDELNSENICNLKKIRFVGHGSSNGIDTNYFTNKIKSRQRIDIRKGLGLNEKKNIIGYIGRVRFDKGIEELVKAFLNLSGEYDNIELLIAGPSESDSFISPDIQSQIVNNPNIIRIDKYISAKEFYEIVDILVFPSHREGFGNISLEASSMGLPVIGTNIMGIREGIENGVTGFLFEKGNVLDLVKKIEALIDSKDLCKKMGDKGRIRTIEKFNNKIVWNGINEVYKELIS